MNAPSRPESTALAVASPQQFDLSPRNFEEAWRLAEIMADSELVPKDFRGKPGNCFVAIQWGAEIGLKAMQAVQNIAVINGRPSLWGDAMLAIVRASPLCEYVQEGWHPDGTAYCKAKRRGEPEQVRDFSDADAKQAGLAGKQGPWTTGPKRMKQLRARSWALRDVFTDVLRGLHMAEEAMDMPPVEKFMGAADVVQPAAAAAETKVATYPQDQFDKNLPTWLKAIAEKKKTADQVIATVESKAPLTEAQKQAIRGEAPAAAATDSDGVIVMTYAQVAEKLHAAKDVDKLSEAATLIATVADPKQREELTVLFEKLDDEMTGGA